MRKRIPIICKILQDGAAVPETGEGRDRRHQGQGAQQPHQPRPRGVQGALRSLFEPHLRQPRSDRRELHQGLRALQEQDLRARQKAGRRPRARLRRLPRDRVHIQAPPDLRLAHPAQPDRARAVRPDADPGVDAEPGDGREQGHLHQAGE